MNSRYKYILYIFSSLIFLLIVVLIFYIYFPLKSGKGESTDNLHRYVQNIPDLTLTDTHNQKYNLIQDDKDKYKLIFFGYTNCPDICPMTLSNLVTALYSGRIPHDQAKKFKIIFITVDPKRDTVERMNSWLTLFSPNIVGLIPTDEQIDSIKREWHVTIYPNNDPDQLYNMNHTDHNMNMDTMNDGQQNKKSEHAKLDDKSLKKTRGDLIHSSYIFVGKGGKIIKIISNNSVDEYVKIFTSREFS